MNLAARELSLIAAAKAKEPMLARTRQLRAEIGLPPLAVLSPPLILGLGDRVG